MKYAIVPFIVTVLCTNAAPSFATDVGRRGVTYCFPAKDVPKLIQRLSEVKPKRRNIVDVRLEPRFIIKDGGVWPERFYLARDGQAVTELPFSRETGAVPSFLTETVASPNTDICVEDPTRADRPKDDEGLYFEMGLSPLFKETTGRHSLADLQEAAKDGKRFYKKMLPGPVALFMPDTNYFAIRMIDQTDEPMAFASIDETKIPLALELVKDMWILRLDDIEALAAGHLIIGGGDYDLQPVPSPKTLRRFGMGDTVDKY